MSWAGWLLFTGVPAQCVVLRVRSPGSLRSCSPVCPLVVSRPVCGVLGHFTPVQWCVGSVLCFVCLVPWATSLLFTCVPARWFVSPVRRPGPLASCSPVCWLGALCCMCGVLGHLDPVQRCARSVRCVARAVSWATWLLFPGLFARCFVLCVRWSGPLGSCCPMCPLGVLCRVVVLRVRCPGPLGSCSPVSPLGVLCCVCAVPGHLAPVHRCGRPLRCVACAVSWASWLLFPGVLARCVALRACVVLGHLAAVHRCARSVCCVACVRCPGALGSCSPVCPLGVLRRVCNVLGHLAPVHRCARPVPRVACAVSWATGLLFTSVPARCVALRVWCVRPLGPCSPVCTLVVLCCVCGVPGLLAPTHRCACSAYCVACAVSSTSWLLFTRVLGRCVVLCVACVVFRVRGVVAGCTLVHPDGGFS